MDVELREIRDFLAANPPFDALPDDVLDALPGQLFMHYFRRGSVLVELGAPGDQMFVVRSGAVDVYRGGVELIERADPGTCVGSSVVLGRRPSRYRIVAIEDTLALAVPGPVLHELLTHESFADFFDAAGTSRLRRAAAELQASPSGRAVLQTRVADVIAKAPITAEPTLSVKDAARLMTEHRVSALLVTEGQRLVGILTDRDLRTDVVAEGLDLDTPIGEVMTPAPATISTSTLVLDATLEMVGRTVHHLPVVADDGTVAGLVSQGDLLRLETASPVFLVGDIAKQTTPHGVADVASTLPRLLHRLLGSDADAHGIQRLATGVADAAGRKLVELAERELGAPPVPYAWVAVGSQARSELGPASDQDHLLLLDDAATPEHDEYFAALAEQVTSGLQRSGYPRCHGDVMATNPRWRQPLRVWRENVHGWIVEPEPESVLRAQIFFDTRLVSGSPELLTALQDTMSSQAPTARRFLGHLATHATNRPMPIGFFRGFVLAREGEHKATVDLKAGGVAPIVEIARIHALAHGIRAVNTLERLKAAGEQGHLSAASVDGLTDAWGFISYLRLRHQADQSARGLPPDNHIAPDSLTPREKKHLKEAFGIVQKHQQALALTYQTQLMS